MIIDLYRADQSADGLISERSIVESVVHLCGRSWGAEDRSMDSWSHTGRHEVTWQDLQSLTRVHGGLGGERERFPRFKNSWFSLVLVPSGSSKSDTEFVLLSPNDLHSANMRLTSGFRGGRSLTLFSVNLYFGGSVSSRSPTKTPFFDVSLPSWRAEINTK